METAVMKLYEGLFLVDSADAAADWSAVTGAVEKILSRADAEVVSLAKWDERKLAYEMKGRSRGTYILSYFNCAPGRIGAIERDVQLSEQILRVMILTTDRMSESDIGKDTPAALMEKAAADAEAKVAEKAALEEAEAIAAAEIVAEMEAVSEEPSDEAVAEPEETLDDPDEESFEEDVEEDMFEEDSEEEV